MSKATGRTASDQRLEHVARSLANEATTQRRREGRARERAQIAERRLMDIVRRESDRFGVPVPHDPFILDILAVVEVHDDGSWTWNGGTNNHGVPCVRWGRSERTVVRVLAETFGVVTQDDQGVLYPLNGRNDVNPFHRVLRRGSNKRMGNPQRFRSAS